MAGKNSQYVLDYTDGNVGHNICISNTTANRNRDSYSNSAGNQSYNRRAQQISHSGSTQGKVQKTALAFLLFALYIVLPGISFAAVTIDDYTTGTATSPGTVTATGSGGEVLIVTIKKGTTPSAMTWGGQSLTKLAEQAACSNAYCGSIWYLLAPPAGTNAASITGAGGSDDTITFLYTGAAEVVPQYQMDSVDTGTSNTHTIVISNAGSYVLTQFGGDGCGGTPSPWTEYQNTNCGQYRVSSEAVNAGSYSNSISGYAHAISTQVEICPLGACGDPGEGGGGGGGGGATTTAATTSIPVYAMHEETFISIALVIFVAMAAYFGLLVFRFFAG